MVKHFYEDTHTREANLTDLLVDHLGYYELSELLGIKSPFGIIMYLQKEHYKREGDVDIVFVPLKEWFEDGSVDILKCVAIEVKSCLYNATGTFKSLKPEKHKKQLKLLIEEGWGRVLLCDIIETEPTPTWNLDHGFQVQDNFKKVVGVPRCGHIIVSVHPIIGRCESLSGSTTGPSIISQPGMNKRTEISGKIEATVSSLFGNVINKKNMNTDDLIIRVRWNADGKEYSPY